MSVGREEMRGGFFELDYMMARSAGGGMKE